MTAAGGRRAAAGGAAAACILAAALCPGSSPAAEAPRDGLGELVGRHAGTRRLHMLDEERTAYLAEDALEIVRTGRRSARIRLTTHFPNGHSCTLEGKARLRREGLVLTERQEGADGRLCRLSVRRSGDRMLWFDGVGSCASYCGMRGTLNGSLPYGGRPGRADG